MIKFAQQKITFMAHLIKIIFPLLFFALFLSAELHAQGDVSTEDKIFFRNEKTYGLTLKTNGWGFDYRFGKRINARKKWIYEGSFNYIKHQKEKKQFNYMSPSLSRFVYGKTNIPLNFRFGIGRQNELFEKFDKNSISIRFVWNAGASVTFLKPIYYKVLENDTFVIKKFDTNIPWWYVWQREPFFKGIAETKIVPGAYAKLGFSFEFSKADKTLSILETGIFAEAYPQKIEIMATDLNHNLLYGVYFSLRFGKVVSGYHIKE